jgi:hypothetical protein
MRLFLPALGALWLAAPALSEPLKVAKGMWATSTDVYISLIQNGERTHLPPEHSTLDECWSSDEQVVIDEGMADLFDGCVVDGSQGGAHFFDMDLVCEFEGIPMTGTAQFAVNRSGDQFSGRVFFSGGDDELELDAEAVLLGYRTGTCQAPQ